MEDLLDKAEIMGLLSQISQEFAFENKLEEQIIGEGYTGKVWKISERLCIKISESKNCPDFPQSIKDCRSLCVPYKKYISKANKYAGYVLNYMNAGALQKFIINKTRLSENHTAYLLFDILQGLAKLHENQYVHRDFHAGNVMLYKENRAIHAAIIDFDDTQKLCDETRPCFRFNGYHAPEVVFKDERYDDRSEVFAAGVMMWELK